MNLDPCRIASEPYYEPLGNEMDVSVKTFILPP